MFFMHLNQIQDEAHTSLKGKLKISNTKMLNRVTWMIIRQIYWWKCKDNSNSVCHVFQALKRHLANLKIEACWVFIIGSPVYLYLKLLCLCLCSWKSYALKAGFIDILCHFRAAERVVPQYSLVLDMSFYVLSKQMPICSYSTSTIHLVTRDIRSLFCSILVFIETENIVWLFLYGMVTFLVNRNKQACSKSIARKKLNMADEKKSW